MPRKPTVSREEMIEGAFQLVRSRGKDALTIRNLASYLGCSTQPIMYQFSSAEELKEETYQHADRFHSEFILAGEDLLQIGLNYIRFAREETNLFRFLFQSRHFSGLSIREMIMAPEAGEMLSAASKESSLAGEEAAAFFEPLFAAVHGYACLIADNAVSYDPEAAAAALAAMARGLMEGNDHDETV